MKGHSLSGNVAQSKSRRVESLPSSEVDLLAVERALKGTQNYLLGIQNQEGYWVGELEADVTVAAGYIPWMHFMAVEVDPGRQQKIVNYVKSKQRVDGSWSAYHDGPGNINVTIQAYFDLKLAGASGLVKKVSSEPLAVPPSFLACALK